MVKFKVKELATGIAVVHVAGSVGLPDDVSNLFGALRSKGLNRIALVVESIGMDALGMVVSASLRLRDEGGALVVVPHGSPLQRTLEISKLDEVISTCGTEEEAVKVLRRVTNKDQSGAECD